jgi:hypothetical protein
MVFLEALLAARLLGLFFEIGEAAPQLFMVFGWLVRHRRAISA